jgi:hypothetical protein
MDQTYVVYFDASPLPLMAVALDRLVASTPDAIVLLTYDSGKVPNCYLPVIREATERRIPVFGVRQTIFLDTQFDATQGADFASYELEPSNLNAGIIPLQGYSFPLLKSADDAKNFAERNLKKYGITLEKGIPLKVNGIEMINHVSSGMEEICSTNCSYEEIVKQARRRFSTPEFNARIDQIIKEPRGWKSLLAKLMHIRL